jgi:hypothetical protein
MNGTGDHHVNQSKPDSKKQRPHIFSHMWKIDLKDKYTHKCKHDHIHKYIEQVHNSETV